jgi:hypothetical protein
MLSYSKCGLTTLNLMVRHFRAQPTHTHIHAHIHTHTHISHTHTQGNRLQGEGLLELSPGLEHNRSLTYISLADNDINNVCNNVWL